jgi:hypothetical protein
VPPDAGLHKRANFSALIVGLAETGDRTRAAKAARSRLTDCAIHYTAIKASPYLHSKIIIAANKCAFGKQTFCNNKNKLFIIPCAHVSSRLLLIELSDCVQRVPVCEGEDDEEAFGLSHHQVERRLKVLLSGGVDN